MTENVLWMAGSLCLAMAVLHFYLAPAFFDWRHIQQIKRQLARERREQARKLAALDARRQRVQATRPMWTDNDAEV